MFRLDRAFRSFLEGVQRYRGVGEQDGVQQKQGQASYQRWHVAPVGRVCAEYIGPPEQRTSARREPRIVQDKGASQIDHIWALCYIESLLDNRILKCVEGE